MGVHKSVESAASACITANVYVLFLSLCSIFFFAVSSYYWCCNVPVSPWGPQQGLLIFTGKTRKHDEQAAHRHGTELKQRMSNKVKCCHTAAAQSSICPFIYSSITEPLACPFGIVMPRAVLMVQKWEERVNGSFMQTRQHKTRCWHFGENWLFDVALRIDVPAIYLQAPASNAHLQIMLNNVNK